MKFGGTNVFVLLFIALIMSFPSLSTVAQTEPTPRLYVCVSPKDETEPYIIEFWDSIAFGIVIPEDAIIRLYSNVDYSTVLYTINSNASTGGYHVLEELAEINNATRIPADNNCLNADTEELFSELPLTSIPIHISKNHALVFQQGGTDQLRNEFRRVISFTFGIDNDEEVEPTYLQLIQTSEVDPFLNIRVPTVEPNTVMLVIANKDFGLSQSLATTFPPEFSRERPSDIRSFVYSDLEEIYQLNLFELAERASAPIYINSGLIDTYRGTYIRLSLAPDEVVRIPPFEAGMLIRALPDATARFVAVEQIAEDNGFRLDLPFVTTPAGQMRGDTVYRIIEIEELSGQLIIEVKENPAIVESWLVEAMPAENN